jgi:transcriptional regulator with XRE-family HTH domain
VGSVIQLIGERLKQARETVGYTPEEVSQKLGITKDELFLLESGRRNPPLSLLRKELRLPFFLIKPKNSLSLLKP